MDRDAPFGQLGRHHIGGAVFLEGGFGMLVDVAADRGQFVAMGLHILEKVFGHGGLSFQRNFRKDSTA